MESRTVQTPHGDVRLEGRLGAFVDEWPLIVTLYGAFEQSATKFFDLEKVMPVAVVGGRLPGHGAPHFGEPSIERFAEAYTLAVRQLFGDRTALILGESAGALIALAMDGPWRRLALEPPLLTSRLKASSAFMTAQAAADPCDADLLWNLFGARGSEWQERDYRHLLDRGPATIMVGADLSPGIAPSVVGTPEREAIRNNPTLELIEVEGAGHLVAAANPQLFTATVRRLLR